MPKDYQEVERIIDSLSYHRENTPGTYSNIRYYTENEVRKALATYGNTRVEEIIKIVENINISTKIDFIKPEDQAGYRRAQTDLLKAIKK
jgi:hypothetical protein